jgi:hypothetical protein
MVKDAKIVDILSGNDLIQDENLAYLINYINEITTQFETLKYKILNIYYLQDIEELKKIVKEME